MNDRGNAKGFVLVATLWALAAIALLAAYISNIVTADIERATEEKRSFEAELEGRSTETTVIYLLATGRMNHRSLILEEEQRLSDSRGDQSPSLFSETGELQITGVTYAGLGRARFSVQDEGGLIPVNMPQFPPLAAVLGHIGIAEENVVRIVARLGDYIDTDDFSRADGAERDEYRLRGKAPPLNWIMSSPMELAEVIDIEDLIAPDQWSELWPLLSVRPLTRYNFNTMHPKVLAALLDLDAHELRDVLEERERRPLSRRTQLSMLSGKHLDIDEMEIAVLPSNFLRLKVWHEATARRSVVGVELTPLGESAPWRKDYRYTEPITIPHDPGTHLDPPLEAATALLR